ncbi:MAG TPA: MopE-related protein [Candidatus Limnocylindrales bacterium]|nr:MopE-related protein [Candidatus Limnocylindrales bacterium]
MNRIFFVAAFVLATTAGLAQAADVAIVPTKLLIVDTTAAGGNFKVVVVAKDPAVTKGTGTDLTMISASLRIAYDEAAGEFAMPQGAAWVKNTVSTSKYLLSTAPDGGPVKLNLIESGKLLKFKAVAPGEPALDISAAPVGEVSLSETIVNGDETTRLCGKFSSCTYKNIAGGLGYKIVCTAGEADPGCSASPASTTTTIAPTTTLDAPTTTLDAPTTTLNVTTTTLDVTTTTLDVTTTTLDVTTTTLGVTTTTLLFCVPETTDNCSTGQPGICDAGTRVCNPAGTAYGSCTPLTTGYAEICFDGLDNDCNGVANDGCVCQLGTPESCNTGQPGFCANGTRICLGTSWGACTPNAPVSPEVCDFLDNDCDGETDEGCICSPNSTAVCSTGLAGLCDVGLATCSADGSGYGSCSQLLFPTEESCGDSVDNDCDGEVDEDCTTTTTTTSTTIPPDTTTTTTTTTTSTTVTACVPVMAPPALAAGTFIRFTRGESQLANDVNFYADPEANALSNADPAVLDASNFIDPAVCGSTAADLDFHWEVRYPSTSAITNPYTLAGITGYRRVRLEIGANTLIGQSVPPVTFRLTATSRLTGLSSTVDILSELSESTMSLTVFNACKGQVTACPTCICNSALALPANEPT